MPGSGRLCPGRGRARTISIYCNSLLVLLGQDHDCDKGERHSSDFPSLASWPQLVLKVSFAWFQADLETLGAASMETGL